MAFLIVLTLAEVSMHQLPEGSCRGRLTPQCPSPSRVIRELHLPWEGQKVLLMDDMEVQSIGDEEDEGDGEQGEDKGKVDQPTMILICIWSLQRMYFSKRELPC